MKILPQYLLMLYMRETGKIKLDFIRERERERGQWAVYSLVPKVYNNVFVFVVSTTLGIVQTFQPIILIYK